MNFLFRSKHPGSSSAKPKSNRYRPCLEMLEDRVVPTTILVNNVLDSGPNSLRAAITQTNLNAGPDEIDFTVTGTIQLLSALPFVTDSVDINGTSAPGFTTMPLVEVNYNGFAGLNFAAGSSGSALRS